MNYKNLKKNKNDYEKIKYKVKNKILKLNNIIK